MTLYVGLLSYGRARLLTACQDARPRPPPGDEYRGVVSVGKRLRWDERQSGDALVVAADDTNLNKPNWA